MPAISDPGEDLVRMCHEHGIKVESVPGPTAFATAMAISGMPSGRFTFEGFLSVNKASRTEHIQSIVKEPRTMIFYEAPHKIGATLRDLAAALGDREIAIVREITKIHEEVIRTTLCAAAEKYADGGLKGEIVLIIAGAKPEEKEQMAVEQAVEEAKKFIASGDSASEAAKKAAKLSGHKKADRRNSTVEEIKAQLDYREENQKKVAAFHTTRTLGADTKVLLDEDAGKFIVTRARNLVEANPDVLDFADVTGCNLDIDESRTELKREDKDGREISYNPPRYEYSYDFYITIFVNNDYFDEIRFKINSDSVDITPPPAMRPGMTTRCNPETNVEYRNCKKFGEEIRQVLTQVRKDVRQQIEQEAAPKTAVTCPYCGATTTPDVNGCCEYCGGAVRG